MTVEHIPADASSHIESLREDNAVLRNRVEDLAREVKELRSQNSGLRSQMQQTERPNMRISYRGFSYGVGSQWGVDSLRRAIEEDGRWLNEHSPKIRAALEVESSNVAVRKAGAMRL